MIYAILFLLAVLCYNTLHMTLTTHSIIAAAVTRPIAAVHPALLFFAALASHYLSDAIPHWDYPLGAVEDTENPDKRHWSRDWRLLSGDIARFAIDGFLGAGIVLLLLRPASSDDWLRALAIIIGGSLPDFLQGVYMFGLRILKPHQRMHDFFHTKILLGPYPLIGIPFQAAIVAACYFIFF